MEAPCYWGLQLQLADSKMMREMLCFTIEMGVVGREGRICETAGAEYIRAMVAPLWQ